MKNTKRHLSLLVCIAMLFVTASMSINAIAVTDVGMYTSGEGTAENPYVIKSAEQLMLVNSNLSASYILGANIDLSSIDSWAPIGTDIAPFTGTFNGNGYIISNITINARYDNNNLSNTSAQVGFFGYTKGATIVNLGIENANYIISSGDFSAERYSNVGGIAGTIQNTNIDSCYFKGTINNAVGKNIFSRAAGIAAIGISSTVTNCYSSSNIYANAYNMNTMAAGLVAWLDSVTINKCYVTGSVVGENTTGYSYVGGANASGNASSIFGYIISYGGTVKNSAFLLETLSANGTTNHKNDVGNFSSLSNNKVLSYNSDAACSQSTYENLGWDFSNTWFIKESTPILKIFTIVRNNIDTDGDGLPDHWEINGVDINNDGIIDIKLNEMGADPNVPDIFVEIDWMVRPEEKFLFWSTQKYRDLSPSESAMKLVYDSFKAHGINIHIDAGPNSKDFVTGKQWGDMSGGNEIPYVSSFDLNNWNNVVNENFSTKRSYVFKHCMFVNQYNNTTSSGIACNIPGQYFIVANQDWVYEGGDTSVAGTFMHELGHTLGLKHGGCDHVHYKPNYLSIMNYLFQTTGLTGTWAINYSDYKLPDLDENNLNEFSGVDPDGLTAGTNLGTSWYLNGKVQNTDSIAKSAIDFNQNGTIDGNVSVNLNNNNESTLLGGHNDWENIIFKSGNLGNEYIAGVENTLEESQYIYEKTLEESLSTNTLSSEGGATIKLVSDVLIVDGDNQKLIFDIVNRTNENVAFCFSAESTALIDSYNENINVGESTSSLNKTRVEIPVTKLFCEGEYIVSCILKYEDATIIEENFTVSAYTLKQTEIDQIISSIEDRTLDDSLLDDDIIEDIKLLFTLDDDFSNHDWNTSAWEKDASGHWHKCNTAGCAEKNNFAGHTPDHLGGATEEYAVKCIVCQYEIESQLGHTWNEGEVTKGPTCATEGEKVITCANCGETKTEVLAKDPTNHEGEIEIRGKEDATCGKEGHTGNTCCLGCEKVLNYGERIEVTGNHTWDDGVVTEVPTCTKEGLMLHTCTVCQGTDLEPILVDANNHVGETEIRGAEAAERGKDGYTGDLYCVSCNVVIKYGETIPALNVWGDVNGNGAVNAQDAMLISQYYAGYDVEIDESSADVNGDGHINSIDAMFISQHYVGIVEEFPVEK